MKIILTKEESENEDLVRALQIVTSGEAEIYVAGE